MKKVIINGNYILYEDGRWFSIDSGKFLKPMLNNKGYERVAIYDNHIRKYVFTHIKVVEYFGDCNGNKIPPNNGTLIELGLSIDHKDRNKHHNYKSNLELVTHQENCMRKFRQNEDYALPF